MTIPPKLLDTWNRPDPRLDGRSLLDHLFDQLDGMYPGRWSNLFPSPTAIANWRAAWGEAFEAEAVTPADVARALGVCQRSHRYPPNLPEFLQAMRIDVDEALDEAITQMNRRDGDGDVWTHPAIFWAAVRVGAIELRSEPPSALRPRFERALRELERRADLPPIPKRVPALPPPPRRSGPTGSPDALTACLAQLRMRFCVPARPAIDDP
ncbi:hypothetical protein VSR82_21745 [Burkholderia sp. JPY481]